MEPVLQGLIVGGAISIISMLVAYVCVILMIGKRD